jgi:hypothetical protein
MDEGVDPTHMCQSMVQKVAQSKQLQAVTDPDILVLFENWLEELEDEVMTYVRKDPDVDVLDIADRLGLSKSGASFLVAKLQREIKI